MKPVDIALALLCLGWLCAFAVFGTLLCISYWFGIAAGQWASAGVALVCLWSYARVASHLVTEVMNA